MKNLYFILLFIFSITFVKSQIKEFDYYFDYLPKSPTSYLFEKYGTTYNSEYTGTNSPVIPLLNVSSGDINISLNLQYISGNGIKVRDEASNVGLGWGMSLPTISQNILGGFDDLGSFYKLKPNFMYNNTPPAIRNPLRLCEGDIPGDLTTVGRDKATYYKSIKNMIPVNGVMQMFNTNFSSYDTSPDIFTCNLFGEKLIFITSNFTTVNNSPYNFSPTFQSINKKGYLITYNSQNLFKITNPIGIQYFFSKVSSYGTSEENLSGKDFYITKIIDKNNNTINFTYEENSNINNIPIYVQYLNYTSYSQTSNYSTTLNFPQTIIPSGTCHYSPYYFTYYKSYDPNLNSPVSSNDTAGSFMMPQLVTPSGMYQTKLFNIQKIEGDFGSINFISSNRLDYPSSKKIDEINLKSYNSNIIVKKINFNYDYFNSQNSTTFRDKKTFLGLDLNYSKITNDQLSKRLKLNSIIINSNEIYSFEYNPTLLVDKDSFAVDYWGNYNGSNTNQTLFANPNDFININIPISTNYNSNKKIADSNYIKAAILEKITYPTKGYTRFKYELNKSTKFFTNTSNISEGHGLRLKKQENFDHNNSFISSVTYEYEGGKIINPLNLFKNYNISEVKSTNSTVTQVTTKNLKSTLASSDNNTSPLSSGDIMGYSTVIKKETNSNENTKGKIITNFFNNEDVVFQYKDDNIPLYIPTVKNNNYIENGQIQSIKYLNSSNTLIKKDSLTYSNRFPDTYQYYGTSLSLSHHLFYNVDNLGTLFPTPISYYSYFPIYFKESYPTEKIINEYYDNKIATYKESYTYNDYYLLDKKSTTHLNGDNTIEQFSYSYTNSILNYNKNIISELIKKTTSKNGKNIYERKIEYLTNGSHYNPVSLKETTLSGEDLAMITYDLYDEKGNLLQYTKKSGIPVTIIWGYNKTQPIAKIEGSNYASINTNTLLINAIMASDTDASQAINNNEEPLLTILDNLRNDPSMSEYMITTYTYDPLIGVRSITPPSGIREYYYYDLSGKLQSIKDVDGNILKEYLYNYKN